MNIHRLTQMIAGSLCSSNRFHNILIKRLSFFYQSPNLLEPQNAKYKRATKMTYKGISAFRDSINAQQTIVCLLAEVKIDSSIKFSH